MADPAGAGLIPPHEVAWGRTAAEVIARWQDDAAFVDAFVAELAALPNGGVFWETPPLRAGQLERPWSWVAVDAPGFLRVRAEPEAFAGPWASAPPGPVATFANLGGDAVLVTPRPSGGQRYPHLLAFTRTAPAADQRALWRAVGEALTARLSGRDPARPVWTSTAGMGVFWLHVRLDDTPKYYRFAAYR